MVWGLPRMPQGFPENQGFLENQDVLENSGFLENRKRRFSIFIFVGLG